MNQIASRPDFTLFEERLDASRLVISVHGAIDLFSAPEFKRGLVAAIDRGARQLVVDLSDTTFVDSTCLGALLTAHRRLRAYDGELVVVRGRANVSRVFEVTGLDTIFTFADSRQRALAGLVDGDSG